MTFLIVNWDRALPSENSIYSDVEQNKIRLISNAAAHWANMTASLSLDDSHRHAITGRAQDEQE
jgi:hypothetical protein